EKAINLGAVLQILANDPCGHLVCYSAKPLSSQVSGPQTLTIETRYDVKAELNNDGTKIFKITSHKLAQQKPRTSNIESIPKLSSSQLVTRRYRYRVLPDWQTSYMWYDVTWEDNPQDSPVVDFGDIEERYPELYPSYKEWQEF